MMNRQLTSRKEGNKDRELAELGVENDFLKRQVEELQERINEVEKFGRGSSTSSAQDGYYDNIKEGHDNSGDLLKELKTENQYLSSQLIEIKTNYAESEQERNTIQLKLRERNEMLKKFSSEVTKYEFEMVKAKQSLGETLNQNIELEQYNSELMDVIEKLKVSGKSKKK
jgi:chromosome segregation ATPase